MAGEWRTLTVDQIKADNGRAIAIGPFGSRMKADAYVAEGVPVVRGNNISDTRVFVDDFVFVSDKTADELRSCNVFAGDLVFPHRGAIGQVGIIPDDGTPRYMLSTSLMKLTCNSALVDPLFVFYFFRSAAGRHALLTHASTVGTPGIGQPLASLRSIRVPIPPLLEQRAIAHILGTLDDKIELNRRMNETLEAMARALFKSWFVDFDPVRAKAEGRARPDGARIGQPRQPLDVAPDLPWPGAEAAAGAEADPARWQWPQHILDLFPARLVDSKLGEIPEGWQVGCVDDEFDLTMGQSPPGETYNQTGDGLPFYQGRADFGSRFPTRRVYCTAPTRLAKAGDTLISVRAPVGDINMATEDCAIGRGVAAARHRSGSRSYTYQFMVGLEEVFGRFEAEGTVFGSIGKKDFHATSCVRPTQAVIGKFEAMLAPTDSRIEAIERESRTLAGLRDALLPKLISGELRLTNVERFAGVVA